MATVTSRPTAIERPNISDLVAEKLRWMVVDGALAPGERINEVHLAADLGVSRTPLREALNALVAEATLTSLPRRGYFVRQLSVEDFEAVFAIRGILDPAALRMAGIPGPRRIERLETINDQVRLVDTPERAIDLDDAWHLELLADCPNSELMDLIVQFMRRTRRYELALMRARSNILRTAEDHDAVIAALRDGDLDTACEALRGNMESGRRPILEWLAERAG